MLRDLQKLKSPQCQNYILVLQYTYMLSGPSTHFKENRTVNLLLHNYFINSNHNVRNLKFVYIYLYNYRIKSDNYQEKIFQIKAATEMWLILIGGLLTQKNTN